MSAVDPSLGASGPVAAFDWSTSALGDRSGWPAELRNAHDIVVNTDFPAVLFWGADALLLYNDAYVELIGDKHPSALGTPCHEVFPEVWGAIDELLQQVRSTRRAVSLKDALFPLRRHGFLEHCWFTFCYSPVLDTDGAVLGVLDIATETTPMVLADRRLRTLTTLLEELATAESRSEVRDRVLSVLRHDDVLDFGAVDLLLATAATTLTDGVPERSADRELHDQLIAFGEDDDVIDEITTAHRGGLPERSRLRSVKTTDGEVVVWLVVEDPTLAVDRLPGLTAPVESAGDVAGRTGRSAAPGPGGGRLGFVLDPHLAVDDSYLDFVQVIGATVTQALGRAAVREVERVVAAADRTMSLAMQNRLLSFPIAAEPYEVATTYVPASRREQVGGDWHDAFRDRDDHLVVGIGDIVGHDMRAAAQMAQVRNLLRGLAYDGGDGPAHLLERLDVMLADLAPDVLGTAVLGRFTAEDGGHRFTWANAGHPPPVLLTPDGRAHLVEPGHELMFGVLSATPRRDHSMVVPPRSTLLMYTDGLVERRGHHLDRGLDALLLAVEQHHDAGPDTLVPRVVGTVLSQLDDAEDDIAVMAIRCG